MILTFKIKHNRDFSNELLKAKQIAEFIVKNKENWNKSPTSKDVKHFGLKSIISNQIIRKYFRNKKIKSVKSVKLTIPKQGIKLDKENKEIYIPSLDFRFNYHYPKEFEKINQIEINNEFVYVSVSVKEKGTIKTNNFIGIDLNTTGHIAVMSNPETGKVWKLGKKAKHIHQKYKDIRRKLQKKKQYKKLKKIKNKEKRIINDLNHKISKKIVDIAIENNSGIKLENLKGIRKNKKHRQEFNYYLNSWSFYQLQKYIEYKSNLNGVPITYVEPKNTSKECSRCGSIGIRETKTFKCPKCGHVDHADVNASFNIALRLPLMENIGQLHVDRDTCNGSTDTPKEATLRTTETLEPPML